jgi:hypothetical protein
MDVKKVSKQQVISDLTKEFNITDKSLSKSDGKGTFLIDKREYERYDTISKLQKYFADKVIIGGGCRVDNITLLYTGFHIEDISV